VSRLRSALTRVAALVRSRRRQDRELDDEIASHLAEAAEEFVAQGLSPDEARQAALRTFGGVVQAKEHYRQVRSFAWVDALGQDLRYACRTLVATPASTAIIVLTLALGIGANTAIFSILNGLLLRSLPVRDPARLVHVTDSVRRDDGSTRVRAWSFPVWAQIRDRAHLFDGATAWSPQQFDLASGGEAQFVEGIWADGRFFDVLGLPAVLGRTFSPLDDRPGGGPDGPVAVISYHHWQRRFGGDVHAIGRAIRLDGVPFTIVGVTPPDFFGLEVGRSFDVIVPVQTERLVRGGDSVLDSASTNFLRIVARLRPGQTLDEAAAGVRGVQEDVRAATLEPGQAPDRFLSSPFTVLPAATGASYLRESYGRPVMLLAAIVALVLIVGCVNVANLQMARASRRRHELTVRLALGASRLRIARQLFAESLIIAGAGAALAVGLAALASRALVQQLSTPSSPVFLDLPVDRVVLAFTAGVAVLTAVLFGTAPAFRATRAAPIDALKAHGRMPIGGGRSRLTDGLVVVQIALSMVLVVAAGLFTRSFAGLAQRPLGLDAERVLVVTVDAQRADADPARRLALFEQALLAARAVPDVSAAAASFLTPLGGGGLTPPVEADAPAGATLSRPNRPNGEVFGNLVSPGFFDTFGTRIVAGRDFTDGDRRGAPRAIVVNEAFVRDVLGGGGAIGRTVTVFPRTPRALSAQIVGVAADAVYWSLHDPAPPTWYLPIAQFDVPGFPFEAARLSVRTEAGSPGRLQASVAAALSRVNPRLVLTFRPLADQVRGQLTRDRLMAQLAGSLGIMALLLAALGVYGVSGHALTRRRTEMAIRVALGAAPAGVVAWALRRLSILMAVGIAAGIAISLWAARFVEGLVYGLEPTEPSTLAAAAAILCATGVLAIWLPARRATRLDPVEVLREG
jgi:predicted permease